MNEYEKKSIGINNQFKFLQIPSQFHKSRRANVILCFSVFVAFDWVKKSIKFAVCVTLHHSKKKIPNLVRAWASMEAGESMNWKFLQ